MLRLRLLGGVSLTRNGAPVIGPASQQRRLALLAAMACAGDRGISRESLLGLLWPEGDSDRGRHVLSQWLFLIRRDLGISDVFLGSTTLQLNPDRLTSDVLDFDAAVANRDDGGAVESYGGPLLHGFFLNEAPGFEQWTDLERDRRHRDMMRVLERLARGAEASNMAQAARWWRQLAELDPLQGITAANVIRTLAESGDTIAALAHARRHEDAVRRELDVGVTPEVSALVARLRSATASGAAVPAAREPSDPYLLHVRERLAPRYIIDRVASRSSLTTVFHARRTADHAPYTVKVFLPDLMARTDHVRLLQELERTVTLQHPSIDAPSEVASVQDVVFAAIPGSARSSLREVLERQSGFTVETAVLIAADIAAALAAAHAHDVLHGDLTPRRISVEQQTARVSDFGFIEAVTNALAATPHDSAIAVGTPAYMSPEQLIGVVTARAASDVFSLGCVLFHMLAGKPPHAADNVRAIIASRLREPAVSVRVLRPKTPADVAALVARLLEPTAAGRPTAADAARELRSLAGASPPLNCARRYV